MTIMKASGQSTISLLGPKQDPTNPFSGPDIAPTTSAQSPTDNPFAGPNNTAQASAPDAPKTFDPATMAMDNSEQEMSPERAQAAEANRQKLATLINNGASKAEIATYLQTQGIDINQVTGLVDALAQRHQFPNTIIPVATKDTTQPTPPEYHGADKGAFDAFRLGARDGLTLGFSDEGGGAIHAATNSVKQLFGGGTDETFGQTYERERDRERQALSDAEHYHGGTFLGGQIASGILTAPIGGGEAALARGGFTAAARLAGEGALLGGLYGAGSANGGLSDRVSGALKGAALGGAGSALLGVPLNAVARRVGIAGPNAGREILNSADRLNAGSTADQMIQPLVGHVSPTGAGGLVHATMEPTLLGGQWSGLADASRRFETNIGNRVGRVANDVAGGPADGLEHVAMRQADAGAPGTLAAYSEESQRGARALYNQAEAAAGDARVPTPRTVGQLDGLIQTWRATPGPEAQDIVNRLTGLRNQLATGPDGGSTSAGWTIDGLRRLRTSFGDDLPMDTHRTLREVAGQLWPTLTDDIFRGLRVAGRPDAANLYRTADQAWAQRQGHLDIIERIVGTQDRPASAGQVMDRISQFSRKEADKLVTAMNAVAPESAASIRGAIISDLGQPIASRRIPGGPDFSLESFVTNWQKLPPASRSIFDRSVVRDLDDLAQVAGGQRQLLQRFGNPSGSGRWAQNAKQIERLGSLGLGATAFTPAGWAALAPLASLPVLGNLLSHPGVARALVRLTEDRWAGGRLPRWFLRRTMEIGRRYPAAEANLTGMVHTLEGTPAHAVTVDQTPQQNDGRQPLPQDGDIDLGPETAQENQKEDGRQPLPRDGFIEL